MSALDVRSSRSGRSRRTAYIVRADGATARPVGRDGRSRRRGRSGCSRPSRRSGCEIEAILLTHCHFDHIGAVAPVARATGAPVYCPEIERPVLADVMRWVPPGFGPFESYEADHTLAGGERLSLAGLDIEVLFTPGHSPGHLTYAIARRRRRRAPRCCPATCCSRGRSGGWICRAATGRRSSARSARCSGASRRDGRLSGAHGRDDAGARARHEPVPERAARARAARESRARGDSPAAAR